MTETFWPRPSLPDRLERDPHRVAFLIPGLGYSAERPLLHFARAVLIRHGWTTQTVWWPEQPPQRDGQDLPAWFDRLRSFVHLHLTEVLRTETAPKVALVGKSIGSFAAALAADRNLPGIWLTPLLRDSPVSDDLRRSTAPFLLVGSTADRSWDAAIARSLGRPFYEADGADHGMETEDDPVNSADILRRTTVAMDEFVARL
ncbi:alpha/beta hydrolase [Actinoplanes subglobosus]|uniref:Alpha/beta hydrolase n=1 Tax=Actinoplanes subglobosus TaxID=1547892 RepID=A0ABV8IVA6_9ACTN